MSFEIRQEPGFFLLNFSQTVDKQLVFDAFSSLLVQDNFDKRSHTLWDFRESLVDLSIQDISDIARAVTLASEQRSNQARSVFVASDPSDTAILQTYITATAHYPVEFRIFNDYQKGVDWLLE